MYKDNMDGLSFTHYFALVATLDPNLYTSDEAIVMRLSSLRLEKRSERWKLERWPAQCTLKAFDGERWIRLCERSAKLLRFSNSIDFMK